MQPFSGRLRDGDRVVFEDVTGFFGSEGRETGQFEVHEGGILSSHVATDHPYDLNLEDGRTESIRVTAIHASNSAGIAVIEFRLEGDGQAASGRPHGDAVGTSL